LTDELPIEIAATRCRHEIKKKLEKWRFVFRQHFDTVVDKSFAQLSFTTKKSLSKNPFIRGTDSVTTVNGANAEKSNRWPINYPWTL